MPPSHDSHRCAGYPQGHECPVLIDPDRIYCSGCLRQRQRELGMGIAHNFTTVGVVLDDFEALLPTCVCGGDPAAPDHEHSLLHRRYEWEQVVRSGGARRQANSRI